MSAEEDQGLLKTVPVQEMIGPYRDYSTTVKIFGLVTLIIFLWATIATAAQMGQGIGRRHTRMLQLEKALTLAEGKEVVRHAWDKNGDLVIDLKGLFPGPSSHNTSPEMTVRVDETLFFATKRFTVELNGQIIDCGEVSHPTKPNPEAVGITWEKIY